MYVNCLCKIEAHQIIEKYGGAFGIYINFVLFFSIWKRFCRMWSKNDKRLSRIEPKYFKSVTDVIFLTFNLNKELTFLNFQMLMLMLMIF